MVNQWRGAGRELRCPSLQISPPANSPHRPALEMPVPAEIMVREAATGPYSNCEQEEIRLSSKMPFCDQPTVTGSGGGVGVALQGC